MSLLERVRRKEVRQEEPADHTAMVVTEMSGLARPIVREATPAEKRQNPNLEVVQIKVPGNLPAEKVLVIPIARSERWYRQVSPEEGENAVKVMNRDQQARSLIDLEKVKFFRILTPTERESVRPEDCIRI